MKIIVINGPNINFLGIREPEIYGHQTYQDLEYFLQKCARKYSCEIECFQSNHEGALVDKIQSTYQNADAIIINPAAYTHTSIAILDALKAVALPAVEVHLSNVNTRETFRQISYAGMACIKTYIGMGFQSYEKAIAFLMTEM